MTTPATTATPTCSARPDPSREGRFVADAICAQLAGHSGTHCAMSLDGTVTAFRYVSTIGTRLTHGLRHDDNEQRVAAPTCEHEDVGADMDGTSSTFVCQRTATKRLVGRNDCELALLCDEHGDAALNACAIGGIVRDVALHELRRERQLAERYDALQNDLIACEGRVERLTAQLAAARALLDGAERRVQAFQDEHSPEECGL